MIHFDPRWTAGHDGPRRLHGGRRGPRADRGFSVVGHTTQAEFLSRLGAGGFVEGLRRTSMPQFEQAANRAGILELLDPQGMGGFRVAFHARNAPADRLVGLTGEGRTWKRGRLRCRFRCWTRAGATLLCWPAGIRRQRVCPGSPGRGRLNSRAGPTSTCRRKPVSMVGCGGYAHA